MFTATEPAIKNPEVTGKVAEQCWFKHMDILRRDLHLDTEILCAHTCTCTTVRQLQHSQRALLITGILSIAHIHAARLSLSLHHSHITSGLNQK